MTRHVRELRKVLRTIGKIEWPTIPTEGTVGDYSWRRPDDDQVEITLPSGLITTIWVDEDPEHRSYYLKVHNPGTSESWALNEFFVYWETSLHPVSELIWHTASDIPDYYGFLSICRLTLDEDNSLDWSLEPFEDTCTYEVKVNGTLKSFLGMLLPFENDVTIEGRTLRAKIDVEKETLRILAESEIDSFLTLLRNM